MTIDHLLVHVYLKKSKIQKKEIQRQLFVSLYLSGNFHQKKFDNF